MYTATGVSSHSNSGDWCGIFMPRSLGGIFFFSSVSWLWSIPLLRLFFFPSSSRIICPRSSISNWNCSRCISISSRSNSFASSCTLWISVSSVVKLARRSAFHSSNCDFSSAPCRAINLSAVRFGDLFYVP